VVYLLSKADHVAYLVLSDLRNFSNGKDVS
jgi:hypothetical protein